MFIIFLTLQPNNEKALYRKSRAYEEKGRASESMGLLKRVTRLYPENTAAKADLARLTVKQKKNKEQEFKMSRKMLGLDKPTAAASTSFLGMGKLSVAFCVAVGVAGTLLGSVAAFYKLQEMEA
jgi:tetratricopeptide (TPR) repeat protein